MFNRTMFIVAFSLLLAMIDVTRSDNTVYLFEPIAQANPEDEEADYKELGHFPSINDAGTVAFSATLSDDSKCIRKKDGPLPDTTVSTIAHTATSGNNNHFHCTTNGPAILFEDLCIAPAINNSGYVSFWGRSCTKRCDNATGSSCGVFLGNGANEGTDPAPINTRINCCGYNATEVMSAYPSINDFGKVAYWASYQEDGCNRRGLFVMDDKIADRDEDNEEDDYCNVGFLWFEGARIIGDANNTIQGIFWGQTSEANETYPYNYIRVVYKFVYVYDEENQKYVYQFTRVADDNTTYAYGNQDDVKFDYFSGVSINNDGKVAFRAYLDPTPCDIWNVKKQGIYTSDGTNNAIIAEAGFDDSIGCNSSYSFTSLKYRFLGYPSINDDGTVVFSATLDETINGMANLPINGGTRIQGIYVSDGENEPTKIIETGDKLYVGDDCHTVKYVSTTWHHALNQDGQVVFWVQFDDDTQAIVRATPIVNASPAVNITAAVSRKTHGSAGDFDIDLYTSYAVEDRQSGPTQVIVTFDKPVFGKDQGLTNDDVSLSSGSVNELLIDNNGLTINMNGATNAEPLTIEFPRIVDARCVAVTDTICFGVLCGDATGEGGVNVLDILAVYNNLNDPADASNFRSDVTANGGINVSDLQVVSNNLNQSVEDCQQEEFRGGGEGGGEMMMAALGTGLNSGGNVSAEFVLHGNGDKSVKLPVEGGTVLVDLVLTSRDAVAAFDGKLVVNAADVVSVASGDWTARANVLASLGSSSFVPASLYDMCLMAWYVQDQNGQYNDGQSVDQIANVTTDRVFNATANLVALDGMVSKPYGSLFESNGLVGGVFRSPLLAEQTIVATLTLDVAGIIGTYQLTFENGVFAYGNGVAGRLDVGEPVTIQVEDEQ